ncbi:hypothetical protein HJC23_006561 [Cyclotella cryptica]|uniref:Uncharacterized protein n=1 Tax=Cyclotella cryptica TaxID=29204 RepID=A0ABD3PLG1_9STRA|eukprot:CCRYP_013658-RA/>CCRYP_013658-RA protein AED:0.20 eAED:0.20 QI:0/-1/0/1/-1/1/1/0/1867
MKGELDVASLSDYECLWRDDEVSPNADSNLSESWGDRTSCLSWIQPCSSGISSLPLLAAAFRSGVAVYHVSTNQIDVPSSDSNERQGEGTPEPRLQPSLSSADTIPPFAKAKYSTAKNSTSLAKVIWFDLGPRSPPCLSIILNEASTSKLNLCVIDIPWYGSTEIISSKSSLLHRSMGVLSQMNLDHIEEDASILPLPRLGAIGLYHAGKMSVYQPTLSSCSHNEGITSPVMADGYFSSLYRPVSSSSLGLNTDGSVYSDKSPNLVKSIYQDTVLTVFSINTCSKIRDDTPPMMQKWTIPSQRNWLLISAPGDRPIGSLLQDETDDNFDISYQRNAERSGAATTVVCELTCGENPVSGLVPERIVREDGGRRVAVLFSSSYFGNNATDASSRPRRRTHTRVSTDPVAYAILDIDEIMKNRFSSSFTLRHARDVAFLPTSQMEGGFYCSSLVVLDADGSGLSITTVISSRSQKDGVTEKVIESEDKCLLHHEGIQGRRVFTLLNGDHPQLLLVGESTVVGRPCLIVAQHEMARDPYSNTFALIEADSLGHRLWLKTGEEVISVRELPKHPEADHAHIAIATQQRVMIVSAEDSLSVVSEVNVYLTSPSLSPVGSHCVAFSAASTAFSGGEACIMYLSCLHSVHRHGVISSLPSQRTGPNNILLTAIRPDRLVYFVSHGGVRLTDEVDEAEDKFDIPIPTSRPILLLEPLLANALCQDRTCGANASKSDMVQQSLRTVIEKFGRKHTSFPHGDSEGIGSVGVGITSKAYQMLAQYQCHQAASLLLRGNGQRMAPQMRAMSPSFSIMSTLMAANNTKPSVCPKPNNPAVMHAENLAYSVKENESFSEAIKMLNFASSQSSEDALRQLVLSLNAQCFTGARSLLVETHNTEYNGAYEDFVTYNDELLSVVARRLANGAKEGAKVNVSQLAPVAQTSWSERSRPRMLKSDILEEVFPEKNASLNEKYCIKDGRHIWCTGPFGRPEKLFRLESFEDWFGRCLPIILGNEGVALAAGTGEQTLANILSAAALEETAEQPTILLEHDKDGNTDRRKNWVEGIGEEHLDEDNLSLYVRFSEGADEDNKWKLDGFSDLSNHGHKLGLYGSELATLEATTSSVDEGEQGKVQLLYDLVFNEGAPRDVPTGVLVQVARGDSLDIGMLHTHQHKPRQKATIEFWYHLPQSHLVSDEIILARRSLFFEDNGDASNICLPDEKHNTLWELALLPTGFLELRTGAGSVVTSAAYPESDDENASKGIVSWEREDGGGGWNHVCLLFSAQSKSSPTEFSASILMNGVKVVSTASLFVNPLEAELLSDINERDLEDAMERSVLAFGIGPSPGFRITDIRVWACLRDEEDIKLMMYEYLRHAEMKKKLKINIRKGPKKSVLPAPPTLPLSQADNRRSGSANPPYNPIQGRNVEPGSDRGFLPDFATFAPSEANDYSISRTHDKMSGSSSTPAPAAFLMQSEELSAVYRQTTDPPADPSFIVTMSDLLSTKVRKSASSAIIRGPPAARHFGGNRGGLLCSRKRQGVGPIAICGSDKSIVFYHDSDPPAKTYPIGASGAVLSDVIDETQSEYMCCFLAKEKRMVVFELALKAVVVELQMKTKLNFWRYLPPEADDDVLTFMLITPIGGFHWKPLDDSPRPRQVWKRGPELESKKILSYEEGGGCGRDKSVRSTVALILASEATSEAAVEAYCISMDNESCRLCISPNVVGAALYQHPMPVVGRFLPCVVYVLEDEACQFHLNVQELHEENNMSNGATLVLGDVKCSVLLDVDNGTFDAPPLSMGSSPEALCCCHDSFIVAIMRKQGLVFAYHFTGGNLSLVGRIMLGHYVVDAAIRSGNASNEVELVSLLCETGDSKDGRVAVVTISKD